MVDIPALMQRAREQGKKPACTVEQRAACKLLARWAARSGRPFGLVEDDGFKEYVEYVSKGVFWPPGRETLVGPLVRLLNVF